MIVFDKKVYSDEFAKFSFPKSLAGSAGAGSIKFSSVSQNLFIQLFVGNKNHETSLTPEVSAWFVIVRPISSGNICVLIQPNCYR